MRGFYGVVMAPERKKYSDTFTARAASRPRAVLSLMGRWLANWPGTSRKAPLLLARVEHPQGFREMTFTFAVIALAAKLAGSDGSVSNDEFLAFRDAFPMPPSEHDKIRQLFMLASSDKTAPSAHAERIATLFPAEQHRELLREVMARLVEVASADGRVNKQEDAQLRLYGRIFGLKPREIGAIIRNPQSVGWEAPHRVLGVSPDAEEEDIRRAYLKLLRLHHPDPIQAQGGSKEAVEAAARHVARINAAYHSLRRKP